MSTVLERTSAQEIAQFDAWVLAHPHAMLWQSSAWRSYQQALGRNVRIWTAERDGSILAGAAVVADTTSGGLSTWECPRGPLWTDDQAVAELLPSIVASARNSRCLRLWASPPFDWRLPQHGFRTSGRHVHPEATVLLNIDQSDEAILAQMHQKCRYNIKVAQKHGVTVAPSSDISAFYALLERTGKRDAFKIHQKSHYTRFLESLEGSFLLLAWHENTPIAGLLGVTWRTTGTYYYGASSYEHRSLMAPYLLQWQAIQHCKNRGCRSYDLLGIDPPGGRATAWQGVTEFKRKFGGEVVYYPREQEYMLRPWTALVLGMKRRILG
jgi:lipid II:glycine glycyltransferase (peptidoglycan interpeptide bridge formation enzyme)